MQKRPNVKKSGTVISFWFLAFGFKLLAIFTLAYNNTEQ